jgi:excisionase family DNA binding protein
MSVMWWGNTGRLDRAEKADLGDTADLADTKEGPVPAHRTDGFCPLPVIGGHSGRTLMPDASDRGRESTRRGGSMANAPVPEQLLTPAEVAALFRVDPKTVTRWAKAGKLTSIRTLGGHRRYRESEVRAVLSGVPAPRAESE